MDPLRIVLFLVGVQTWICLKLAVFKLFVIRCLYRIPDSWFSLINSLYYGLVNYESDALFPVYIAKEGVTYMLRLIKAQSKQEIITNKFRFFLRFCWEINSSNVRQNLYDTDGFEYDKYINIFQTDYLLAEFEFYRHNPHDPMVHKFQTQITKEGNDYEMKIYFGNELQGKITKFLAFAHVDFDHVLQGLCS